MIVGKWNEEIKDYEPYVIPDDWNVPLYTENMDEIVNCAACGREVKFGDCYTSRVIHGKMGFGYGVCSSCHDREWGR